MPPLDHRDEVVRKIAQAASGHPREEVINATGVVLLNALRQQHQTLVEAEREFDDLVKRMRAVMRENHYDSNGQRRVTNIIIPPLGHLLRG